MGTEIKFHLLLSSPTNSPSQCGLTAKFSRDNGLTSLLPSPENAAIGVGCNALLDRRQFRLGHSCSRFHHRLPKELPAQRLI